MDNVSLAILQKICNETNIGRYAIISEEEFFDALPESETPYADLSRALSALTEDGYIDIKYSGGDMYCLTPKKLPPAPPQTVIEENAPDDDCPPDMPETRRFFQFLFPALGGFFGGLFGGLLTTVFMAVL